jgi:pimeloyl-ACP methyl ester carboxylesterase
MIADLARARVRGCCLFVLTFLASNAQARVFVSGDLPRQADLGFLTSVPGPLLSVIQVTAGSLAAAQGLRMGDLLTAVNGKRFSKPYEGQDLLEKLDGGVPVTLTVTRDGRPLLIRYTPPPRPFEKFRGLDTYYGVIETPDGARLRTILTRPEGSSGRLPAIFFVQWVGCESVDFTGDGAWLQVFRGVAERSGMAFARTERASSGDSEGPGCHLLDFDTELAHYRFALDELGRGKHVDASQIVVFGNSLGTMLVPLLIQGRSVAGAIITSGGALTYYERMLNFERQVLERRGGPPPEIHGRMTRAARFYTEYLLNGSTPEQIAARDPELGAVWRELYGTGDGVQYNRPYAYHQQLARKNVLGAWAESTAPVLVLFNSFDQSESLHGAEVVAETVNRLRPGSAEFVLIPELDHSFYLYPSIEDAALRVRERRVAAPEPAIHHILAWLKRKVRPAP